MRNARLYAKIMRHMENTTGTGFWDFRTLNISHPQLANKLHRILADVVGKTFSDTIIRKHYMPRRLWNYESEVTV